MITQEYYLGLDLGQKKSHKAIAGFLGFAQRGAADGLDRDPEPSDVRDGEGGCDAAARAGEASGAGTAGDFVYGGYSAWAKFYCIGRASCIR
jgi:hypothetical protein